MKAADVLSRQKAPAKGWPQVHRAGEETEGGAAPSKPKETEKKGSTAVTPVGVGKKNQADTAPKAGAAWPKVRQSGEADPQEASAQPARAVKLERKEKKPEAPAATPPKPEPGKNPAKAEQPSDLPKEQKPPAKTKRAPSTPSVASWLQRPTSSVKPHMAVSGADAARAVDLFKQYGEGDTAVLALDHVSVAFRRGEFTAIMGPSGSGKSTLMHCMAGLDAATGGQVMVGSTDLSTLDDKAMTDLRRDRLGFIFQSFNLVPTLTAAENITLPIDIAGGEVDEEWFEEITQRLGLTERLNHRPSELSGGQQQRVACARALVSRPEIIFGDEPTGNLDSNSSTEVLSILRTSVDQDQQTVVIVTHDARAASYADKVIFLADGKIVDELAKPSIDQILSTMAGIERG